MKNVFRFFYFELPITMYLFAGLMPAFTSCHHIVRNTSIPKQNSRKPLTLICGQDSLNVTLFLNKLVTNAKRNNQLVSFYKNRKYVPAWINSSGVNENVGNFINFLNNEKTVWARRAFSTDQLQELYQAVSKDHPDNTNCADTTALKLEILLTRSFFEFAERNWVAQIVTFRSRRTGSLSENKLTMNRYSGTI